MPLPLLFLLASGAKVASSIQQGRIADAEGRAQAKLDERNAAIFEQDADARERKARFDQLRQVVSGVRVLGRLRARLGASGARLDVGAPIRALSDQAEELELDNLLIGFEGAVEAGRFRERAVISRFKGSLAKTRGKAARRASLLTAFAGAAGDFATFRSELPSATKAEVKAATGAGTPLRISGVTEAPGPFPLITPSGKSIGSLRGRRVKTTKKTFAGTNTSSASPFGTVSA